MDDALQKHGCVVVSKCSHCGSNYETTTHLLFQCPFPVNIWTWLSIVMGVNLLQFEPLELLDKFVVAGSSQMKDIFLAGVINTI